LPQDPFPPAGGAPQAVTVMVAVVVAAVHMEEELVVIPRASRLEAATAPMRAVATAKNFILIIC